MHLRFREVEWVLGVPSPRTVYSCTPTAYHNHRMKFEVVKIFGCRYLLQMVDWVGRIFGVRHFHWPHHRLLTPRGSHTSHLLVGAELSVGSWYPKVARTLGCHCFEGGGSVLEGERVNEIYPRGPAPVFCLGSSVFAPTARRSRRLASTWFGCPSRSLGDLILVSVLVGRVLEPSLFPAAFDFSFSIPMEYHNHLMEVYCKKHSIIFVTS